MVGIPREGITVYNTVPIKLAELEEKLRIRIDQIAEEIRREALVDTRKRWRQDIGTGLHHRYPPGNPAYGSPMPNRITVEKPEMTEKGAGFTINAEGADILAHEFGLAPSRHVLWGRRGSNSPFLGILPHNILRTQAMKWGMRFRNKIMMLIRELKMTEGGGEV